MRAPGATSGGRPRPHAQPGKIANLLDLKPGYLSQARNKAAARLALD